MNFESSLEAWGTPDFLQAVEADLLEQESHFPLDYFLEHGGFPDDCSAEFSCAKFSDTEDSVIVKGTVYFTEVQHTACKDFSARERVQGNFVLTIEKETAYGEVEQDSEAPSRNLENY